MADFIKNIQLKYKRGDILIKFIFINVAVFLLIRIFLIVCKLFKIHFVDFTEYIGVSSSLEEVLRHPWTLLTYMFVHIDILHILFNMLILYWFGKIFLAYFSPKNLGGLYVLGGLSGAVLFLLCFNTIPYYVDLQTIVTPDGVSIRPSVMIGASASVMAIIFAASFYRPHAEVGLLFLGRIKIIYIAVFLFILDFLALDSTDNPGGRIAHIGGAIIGFIFAKQYLKGKDITRWMNRVIDFFANLFKPRPHKLKVKKSQAKHTETDYEYNGRKNRETADIDTILDKIKMSGYSSLSQEEKKRLFDASNKS